MYRSHLVHPSGVSPSAHALRRHPLTALLSCRTSNAYLTLTIKNLGFNTLQTNLMAAPAAAMTIVLMFSLSIASDRFNTRAFAAFAGALYQVAVS